jgi:butyrate kinase
MIRSLIINPGSTSTKIAVFEALKPVFQKSLAHSTEQLAPYKRVVDQFEFRRDIIVQALKEANILMSSIHVIMARGGLIHPVESGIYRVSPRMVVDLKQAVHGAHASNLGMFLKLLRIKMNA